MKEKHRKNPRKSLVEDHFSIDKISFALLGPLAQDANRARDYHDYFNIISLPIVCALNALCWNFQDASLASFTSVDGIESMWRGYIGDPTVDLTRDPSHFYRFTFVSILYVFLDLAFVILLPKCVRSPSTIIIHHVVTLWYMTTSLNRSMHWAMGACLSVEINTWFLILRRVINKDGVDVWRRVGSYVNVNVALPENPCEKKHPRDAVVIGADGAVTRVRKRTRCTIKLVSICFYITWILIRIVVYPLLIPVFYKKWHDESIRTNLWIPSLIIAPIFQTFLTYLNLKWSIDLVRSKCKGRGPSRGL
jgi:hypothetical protein